MGSRNNRDPRNATPDSENSVEFCVKPAEDLVLEGTHKSLLRVRANTPYSCIMLKTQRFASLFRHYAKHHGLDKEELVFYFTEELQNEDTPETVHMQRNDEIIVRTRKTAKPNPPAFTDSTYFQQMKALLFDEEHADVEFLVGATRERIPAHKAILTARSDYFKALFKKGGMRESEEGRMVIEGCNVPTIRRMLEFIYTNRIDGLNSCSASEIIDLLSVADEYLLQDLRALCEHAGAATIDTENVGKLLTASEKYSCSEELKKRCIDYVLGNADAVCEHPSFKQEIQNAPGLFLPIIKAMGAAASSSGRPPNKRPKLA